MRRIGRWLQGFLMICLVGIIAMNGILLVKRIVYKEELPSLFGYSMITVLSGSMEPEFSPGDSLIIRKQHGYTAGDIVTYADQGAFITHRIVEKQENGYLTKGDANNAPDGRAVREDGIYGKVRLVIPYLGNVVLFLKSSLGIFIMIVILILLVEMPNWRKKRAVSQNI